MAGLTFNRLHHSEQGSTRGAKYAKRSLRRCEPQNEEIPTLCSDVMAGYAKSLAPFRLIAAWLTVTVVQVSQPTRLIDAHPLIAGGLFAWLLGVILWSAFGVVHEAEEVAERLQEPLGTLVLTLSIVIIEVALIAAVMLGAKHVPTLGRDTMFAVLMIVLNGVVGLCLLIGGWRFQQQSHNLQGASAYLTVILPLSVIALVLPNFTTSGETGTLSVLQAVFFSFFTIGLYACFLWLLSFTEK